jgi:hypothetical protein
VGDFKLDNYLQQSFDIHSLKIGAIRYAGVLKIGTAGIRQQKSSNIIHAPAGGIVSLSTAPTFLAPAVPLQAPIRTNSE